MGKRETVFIAHRSVKWGSQYINGYGNSSKTWKLELPYEPAAPLLGVFLLLWVTLLRATEWWGLLLDLGCALSNISRTHTKWLLPKVMFNGHKEAGLLDGSWVVSNQPSIYRRARGSLSKNYLSGNVNGARLTTLSWMLLNLSPLGLRKTSHRSPFPDSLATQSEKQASLNLRRKEGLVSLWFRQCFLCITGWPGIHAVAQGSCCGLNAKCHPRVHPCKSWVPSWCHCLERRWTL